MDLNGPLSAEEGNEKEMGRSKEKGGRGMGGICIHRRYKRYRQTPV